MSIVGHLSGKQRRGNALILVVGILVLLVLVATVFIAKTQSGRATAISQRDASQIADRANTVHRQIAAEIACKIAEIACKLQKVHANCRKCMQIAEIACKLHKKFWCGPAIAP